MISVTSAASNNGETSQHSVNSDDTSHHSVNGDGTLTDSVGEISDSNSDSSSEKTTDEVQPDVSLRKLACEKIPEKFKDFELYFAEVLYSGELCNKQP